MGKALPQSAAVMVKERRKLLQPGTGCPALTAASRGAPRLGDTAGGTPYKVLGRAGGSAVSPHHSHTWVPSAGTASPSTVLPAVNGHDAPARSSPWCGCHCSLQLVPSSWGMPGVPGPRWDPNRLHAKRHGQLSLGTVRESECLGSTSPVGGLRKRRMRMGRKRRMRMGRQAGWQGRPRS